MTAIEIASKRRLVAVVGLSTDKKEPAAKAAGLVISAEAAFNRDSIP
jgi:hypothetical protein